MYVVMEKYNLNMLENCQFDERFFNNKKLVAKYKEM